MMLLLSDHTWLVANIADDISCLSLGVGLKF